MHTQADRHTYSGNLGIVKILRYIRSDMYIASATNRLGRICENVHIKSDGGI